MKRRTLLRAILGITMVAALPLTGRAAAAVAAPRVAPVVGGSGNAKMNTWVALPDSGGLEVHLTAANGRTAATPIRWTADGVVTVTYPAVPLTVTAPPADGTQRLTMGGKGFGLTVRRAAQ